MTPVEQADLVRQWALEAGFDLVGIAPAQPIERIDYVRDWLDRGCASQMDYLRRWHHLRADPRGLLEGAKSVIVVAHNYKQSNPGGAMESKTTSTDPSLAEDRPARGRIARYVWGRDYHRVVRKKLRQLTDMLREVIDEPFDARVCVDTAPIIEREFAAAAGIGWIGKNTMVVNQQLGSFFFLGEIVTTLDLAPSMPAADHCGKCKRCLKVCPTGALVRPYQMDASRCIAYLTIEHRSDIPHSLWPQMDNWVFGCDLCQEVCPFNKNAPHTAEPAYDLSTKNTLVPYPLLVELMNWTENQYQQQLTGSAMRRATLDMLKRNATIAFKNWQAAVY